MIKAGEDLYEEGLEVLGRLEASFYSLYWSIWSGDRARQQEAIRIAKALQEVLEKETSPASARRTGF